MIELLCPAQVKWGGKDMMIACGMYVNPQIETNSIRKWGFPIWEYSSLPAHFRTLITKWKW